MDLEHFLRRAEVLIDRVEALLPPTNPQPDWDAAHAFVWRRRSGRGYLQAVRQVADIGFSSLRQIGPQLQQIEHGCQQRRLLQN